MTRRCSHCSHNGHNSRTCPNRGVKIFGVRLTDGSIRKSASMGNLSHYMATGTSTPQADSPDHPSADGYASEDFVAGSSNRERKKGVPWTEEEHRMFLLGLQKLGKGDWRGIARNYVISRTPTQVASHAQKYFIRKSNMSRRKRRSSLFDIVADDSVENQVGSGDIFSVKPQQTETQGSTPIPAPSVDEECDSMESTNCNDGEAMATKPQGLQYPYPVIYSTYITPFFPMSIPYWPGYSAVPTKEETHEVVKPTAVHSKSPINIDELVGLSKLSLGESIGDAGPSSLSLELAEGSARPSAFHANPSSGNSGTDGIHNAVKTNWMVYLDLSCLPGKFGKSYLLRIGISNWS